VRAVIVWRLRIEGERIDEATVNGGDEALQRLRLARAGVAEGDTADA
jgi:hypothetical protein